MAILQCYGGIMAILEAIIIMKALNTKHLSISVIRV